MFVAKYMKRTSLWTMAMGTATQTCKRRTSSFTMTLERAVGGNLGRDHDLSQCRKWDGEVRISEELIDRAIASVVVGVALV